MADSPEMILLCADIEARAFAMPRKERTAYIKALGRILEEREAMALVVPIATPATDRRAESARAARNAFVRLVSEMVERAA